MTAEKKDKDKTNSFDVVLDLALAAHKSNSYTDMALFLSPITKSEDMMFRDGSAHQRTEKAQLFFAAINEYSQSFSQEKILEFPQLVQLRKACMNILSMGVDKTHIFSHDTLDPSDPITKKLHAQFDSICLMEGEFRGSYITPIARRIITLSSESEGGEAREVWDQLCVDCGVNNPDVAYLFEYVETEPERLDREDARLKRRAHVDFMDGINRQYDLVRKEIAAVLAEVSTLGQPGRALILMADSACRTADFHDALGYLHKIEKPNPLILSLTEKLNEIIAK